MAKYRVMSELSYCPKDGKGKRMPDKDRVFKVGDIVDETDVPTPWPPQWLIDDKLVQKVKEVL